MLNLFIHVEINKPKFINSFEVHCIGMVPNALTNVKQFNLMVKCYHC